MQEKRVCPVCDGAMAKSDLPKHAIYVCEECSEIAQLVGDEMMPISSLLVAHSLGDERVRRAISTPRVRHVQSFIDIYENTTRFLQMDLAVASSGMRTHFHRMENLCDSAISCFTGLDLVSDDEVARGLRALRELRELISTLPPAGRGVGRNDDEISDDEVKTVSPSTD